MSERSFDQRYGGINIKYYYGNAYIGLTPDTNYGLAQTGSEQDGGEVVTREVNEDTWVDLNSEGDIVGIELADAYKRDVPTPQFTLETLRERISPRLVVNPDFVQPLQQKLEFIEAELEWHFSNQ